MRAVSCSQHGLRYDRISIGTPLGRMAARLRHVRGRDRTVCNLGKLYVAPLLLWEVGAILSCLPLAFVPPAPMKPHIVSGVQVPAPSDVQLQDLIKATALPLASPQPPAEVHVPADEHYGDLNASQHSPQDCAVHSHEAQNFGKHSLHREPPVGANPCPELRLQLAELARAGLTVDTPRWNLVRC